MLIKTNATAAVINLKFFPDSGCVLKSKNNINITPVPILFAYIFTVTSQGQTVPGIATSKVTIAFVAAKISCAAISGVLLLEVLLFYQTNYVLQVFEMQEG